MIRILVCDDEGIVQQSLKFMIQKSFGNECELEFAKNGKTAIALAESFRPDIVLMDIQMPGINGIDAMRQIRGENKNIVFIVLTAYDKFEYTKSSIDIGVQAYLTKPINRDILTETLRKAMGTVREEKEKVSQDLKIREKLEAVVPIIENGLVFSVFLEGVGEEAYHGYRELLNLGEEYGYVIVIACGEDLQGGRLSNTVGSGVKLQTHYMVFREIVKEITSGIVGAPMANRAIVLIPCKQSGEEYGERVKKIDQTRHLLRKLEHQTGLKFRAGIGSVKNWKYMAESYREAVDTLRQGIGKVTHARDLSVRCIYEESYPDELERELFEAVEQGDQEQTVKLSARFYGWMISQGKTINNSIRLKAMEFVLWAERIAYMQGSMVYRFSAREQYLGILMSFQTIEELELWFVRKMEEAAQHVAQKQQEKTDNVVDRAKEYIADHFLGEMSLDEMAKEVGISPYYLSKLFKEAEGVNYIDYVTRLRIDYAKEQLLGTEKSIKEICLDSGYGDPNYFSRIFKKWTGSTPTEFRERRS